MGVDQLSGFALSVFIDEFAHILDLQTIWKIDVGGSHAAALDPPPRRTAHLAETYGLGTLLRRRK